jgi:putative SOS response-associated peptidase YedK
MCNLYRLRSRPDHLRELLGYVEEHDFPPRSCVSPGSPIAIIRAGMNARHLALVRWGFIPSWAKEVAPGKPLTNARIETILQKASFRNSVRRRRCLIPADGYYEWSSLEGRRQTCLVTRADGEPFALAGLWEHWLGSDGSELETAAIITTPALPPLAVVHPRMPVIVVPHLRCDWLANERVDAEKILAAVRSHPDPTLIVQPVGLEPRMAPDKPSLGKTHQLTLF